MARGVLGGVARRVSVYYTGNTPQGAALTIKKEGTATNDAVGTGEELVFLDFEATVDAAATMSVSSSGVTVPVFSVGFSSTNGGGVAQSGVHRKCGVGKTPTITASAGNVLLVGVAEIVKRV